MKLFVCNVIYTRPQDEVKKIVEEHRAYLKEGYRQGFLLASGPKVSGKGGIIIGKFDSLESAIIFSKSDPYCINGVAEYEFIEFEAVLSHEILKSFLASS